jgi:hypothetical protein
MDVTRRELLVGAAALLVEQWATAHAIADPSKSAADHKVALVTCGGMRREDTFAPSGFGNISHLHRDLLPKSLFFPAIYNKGVTSHYNTISSVLTGNWQRVDDWGKTAPASPTIFEYMRKALRLRADLFLHLGLRLARMSFFPSSC